MGARLSAHRSAGQYLTPRAISDCVQSNAEQVRFAAEAVQLMPCAEQEGCCFSKLLGSNHTSPTPIDPLPEEPLAIHADDEMCGALVPREGC